FLRLRLKLVSELRIGARDMTSCLYPELLEKLLDGQLSPEEADNLWKHLANCSKCQALFDERYDSDEWKSWAPECWPVATASPSEPPLDQVLARLHAEEPVSSSRPKSSGERISAPLGFLSPSEYAGDLGKLGPYRVLAELGRGGMGIVLLAYDSQLQRRVA